MTVTRPTQEREEAASTQSSRQGIGCAASSRPHVRSSRKSGERRHQLKALLHCCWACNNGSGEELQGQRQGKKAPCWLLGGNRAQPPQKKQSMTTHKARPELSADLEEPLAKMRDKPAGQGTAEKAEAAAESPRGGLVPLGKGYV
ncbi:hypothetical protein NDU88_006660 [Pleurodeles waltl]|uniref:Uncharacterized protein n=1 Tax=Pleurodeles waltl TaxID=8319 RepID=A0AAV7TY87_PLEWA|nr:hypothetical protein NDU88_006660 [Pleurodeles waltl]